MHRRAHALVTLVGLVAIVSATAPSRVDLAGQQIRDPGPAPDGAAHGPARQPGAANRHRAPARPGRRRRVGAGAAARDRAAAGARSSARAGSPRPTKTGRWEIKDLPAGRYNLTASKGGYVQLNYGQRRPFERGRPIELADGQTLENVNFNLPRGSVIAGRIVDEFGEPVADAMVSALHYRTFSGRRRLVPVGRFGTTDDMGHFRLYGLAPGDYYVSATLRPIGGMGFEVGQSDVTTGYAPTYYPGTASSQQADRISVGLGGEMSGITFSLLPVRTVKVSGTAVDSSGKPMAGAFVMLSADMRSGEGGFMMFGGGGNQVKDDGTFVISNVTPGDYVVRAMAWAGPRRGDDDAESATASVSVGGEDVTGVTLIGTKGTSLRGQVVVQPASAATGIKPSDVSVNAMAKDPDAPMMFMGGDDARPASTTTGRSSCRPCRARCSSGPFRTPAGLLAQGRAAQRHRRHRYRHRLQAGRDGHRAAGRAQHHQQRRRRQCHRRQRQAGGRLRGDRVLGRLRPSGASCRATSTMARPDQQGGFQAKNLPPGRYLAVAVEAVEEGQETDPEFLERLRSLATAFTLGEGEQRSVALKIVQAY